MCSGVLLFIGAFVKLNEQRPSLQTSGDEAHGEESHTLTSFRLFAPEVTPAQMNTSVSSPPLIRAFFALWVIDLYAK